MKNFGAVVILIFFFASPLVLGACPYSATTNPVRKGQASPAQKKDFLAALAKIDFEAVKTDIKALFVNSQDFWPADFGNYGPLFIRHAWHCAGSYRKFDGRGGCDGARIRFDPERSWPDNTNLDKAKRLLWPIKQKYGLGLSWGDLIALTGTTAIESMGGPILGFCAGRTDDTDGSDSDLLGPTEVQNSTYPCVQDGNCTSPLGPTTMGLIYVNPEGPMGNPIPAQSALQIRDSFGRMGMDDYETVALIGGGHAFGKTHGACPLGPGKSPKEDPANPWPGLCGTGKGRDAFTSGFEGPWTLAPTTWTNLYFTQLINNQWEVFIGPGGKHQWRTVNGTRGIMMLTTDISLLNDPEGKYQPIVKLFASNLTALNDAFARAWYKLMSRDMGPVTRCVGPWVPPPQPFQFPLPPTPAKLPDFNQVRDAIRNVITSTPAAANAFVYTAYQCASTFRSTDYIGGCNGARIRFPPQSTWPANAGVSDALQMLAPVQRQFANLSWADTIVLAGTVALDIATGSDSTNQIGFCGGRTDATDGAAAAELQPNGNLDLTTSALRLAVDASGLSDREYVALLARPRSAAQMARLGYFGSFTDDASSSMVSNQYFNTLLKETWVPYTVPASGKLQYQAQGKQIFALPIDLSVKYDAAFLAIAEEYASNNQLFLAEFKRAWAKLMNIDRFDGPAGNLCDDSTTPTTAPTTGPTQPPATPAPTLAPTQPPTQPPTQGPGPNPAGSGSVININFQGLLNGRM